MHRRLLLLVLMINVGVAMLYKKLSRFILASTCRIVQWRLSIVIDGVRVCVELCDQTLYHLNVILSRRIKQRSLRVRVLVIHIATKFNEQLSQVNLAITACII